jgi:hypothetical protein
LAVRVLREIRLRLGRRRCQPRFEIRNALLKPRIRIVPPQQFAIDMEGVTHVALLHENLRHPFGNHKFRRGDRRRRCNLGVGSRVLIWNRNVRSLRKPRGN